MLDKISRAHIFNTNLFKNSKKPNQLIPKFEYEILIIYSFRYLKLSFFS
jgi:hypothetical protein